MCTPCSKPPFSGCLTGIQLSGAGGALLLGVQKPVVVAHGSSQADGIYHAILLAHRTIQEKTVQRINNRLEKLLSAVPPHTLKSLDISNSVASSSRFE